MDSLTKSETKSSKFNVVEYATHVKFSRHLFRTIDKPIIPSEKEELYCSHFLHSEELSQFLEKNRKETGKPSIGGYDGEISSDKIVIDIDSADLEMAHKDAKVLTDYLAKEYDLNPTEYEINFSGSKGFHIRIPAENFGGFIPSDTLNDKIKSIAFTLAKPIEIDPLIYSKTSFVRVVNTLNKKSGLYAVPLTFEEFSKLSMVEIKELAKAPREIEKIDCERIQPNPKLVQLKEKVEVQPEFSSDDEDPKESDGKGKKKSKKKHKIKKQAQTGERHATILNLIGKLIDSSLSDEEIIMLAELWNKQNDPPLDDERLEKEINGAFDFYRERTGEYWRIKKGENGFRLKVTQDDFIKYLNKNGYAKTLFGKIYEFVQINQNVAKVITPQDIKDFVLNELEKENTVFTKKVKEYLLDKVSKYFSERFLETVTTQEIIKMSDPKDCSYLFFKNTVVKVNKSGGYELMEYKDLPSTIWSTQIQQREFKKIDKKTSRSEFEQFLYNTVGRDDDKLLAISSAIGYLLHRYKDKSVTKAIVLMDEAIDSEPEGRTGKSLIGKAISYFRESVRIDSKNFTFGDKFTFQQINPSSDIIEFNDVKQNFDFEKLFSVITDDMTVEYKNKHPFVLKFEESPKFMISTNYTIKGTGSSFSDRLFEIALTNHYNESNRPKDEFGHQFFDDWDEAEWNRFDHFMIECIELYLQYGLVKNESEIIKMKKLISETSEEFIEFIESPSFVKNSEYWNYDIYNDYKSKMKMDMDTMNNNIIDLRIFMKYIRKWASLRGYDYKDRKSNGKQYFGIYYNKVTK
ncbi:MAG: primase C-terminal domain-containing protein [Melioribacteraceae bacterium]|nr:primase C-terminal domain-containing protein [Melioribacteraceae bacterium]